MNKIIYTIALLGLINASGVIPAYCAETKPEVVEAKLSVDKLPPTKAYEPENNTILVELSQYAGYAGLVVANGGLEPTEDSVFFKKHGFKLKLVLSEEESWGPLNEGRMAASATTVDVLAVYGRQFAVTVPAQIGYSRGADALVTLSAIKNIKDLRGKRVITSQFTEADFFMRYLASESGIGVAITGANDVIDSSKINLVFANDAFGAGDLFLEDINSGKNRYSACVTWDPKTTEIVQSSRGRAAVLASNRNILVIGDILIVNKGFEKKYPKLVMGLVDGLLEGNRMVRDHPEQHLDTIGKAMGWSADEAKFELKKVHLSNLPENIGFMKGEMLAGGSFDYIYQTAIDAYGSDFISNPTDSEYFKNQKYLDQVEVGGGFKNQAAEILPVILESVASVETTPIDKDIRFLFLPNDSKLDLTSKDNLAYLASLANLLRAGVGSRIQLIGHVEGSQVAIFKAKGDAFFKQMELAAVSLSRNRAISVKNAILEKYKIDADRIEVLGRGWKTPTGDGMDKDRRVQAQWSLTN